MSYEQALASWELSEPKGLCKMARLRNCALWKKYVSVASYVCVCGFSFRAANFTQWGNQSWKRYVETFLKEKIMGEKKKKTIKKTTVQNIHWIKLTFQTRIIIYLDNLIDLYWNFTSLVGQYFALTTGWYFCFQYVLVAFILRWKWENIEAKK